MRKLTQYQLEKLNECYSLDYFLYWLEEEDRLQKEFEELDPFNEIKTITIKDNNHEKHNNKNN